jgi:DNA-binding GntR family transcriptional regulator
MHAKIKETDLIVRQPLREQVYVNLLLKIHAGTYRPGEALLRLEQEGLVTTEPGYGFAIRPLSAQEIRDNYPILSALECLALRTSSPLSAAQIKKLNKLNESITPGANNEARLIDLDERWHSLLLSNCENKSLTAMINGLKANLRRYELAYMRDARRVASSNEHHLQITKALENADMIHALEWLERNWIETAEQLATWLIDNHKTAI